jgi:hypothetical protein
MKNIIVFFIIALMSFGVKSFSFQKDDLAEILSNANVQNLSTHFEETIELEINDKSQIYSKKQAEFILNTFFSELKIIGFDMTQEGKINEMTFFVGNLKTTKKVFKTTIIAKSVGTDGYTIKEIRFE